MLISGPYLRLHSEFEAEKSCIRRETDARDIAQDGPETALCKSPFSADAAVLEVAALLCVLNAALLATPACMLITSGQTAPEPSTTLNNESICNPFALSKVVCCCRSPALAS
jgi:hypothetical protein